MIIKVSLVTSIALLLTGCAGAIFGGAPDGLKDMENLGTRGASRSEEKVLDRCLNIVFLHQRSHYNRFRRYQSDPKGLRLKDACDDLELKISMRPKGYLATARMVEDKSIVRWTVDQSGSVYEHTDFDIQEDAFETD